MHPSGLPTTIAALLDSIAFVHLPVLALAESGFTPSYQDVWIKTIQSSTAIAGARLTQLPRHTLSLWNRYDLSQRWGIGVGAIHRDKIYAATDNNVKLPGFIRFDVALFCRLSPKMRAQLNLENVLDRAYYASANSNTNITPGSPRAIRVSLTTGF